MARSRFNLKQIKITRNNNGVAGSSPTQREIGWGKFQYNNTASVSGTVTFINPFPAGVIPIVVATFAGDATGIPDYGSGGNNAIGRNNFKITAVSNTGFSWWFHTGDGAAAPSTAGGAFGFIAEG